VIGGVLRDPSSKLASLYLCHIGIGAVGACELATALLAPNCQLILLDVGGKEMGDVGKRYLSAALRDPNGKLVA